MAISAEKTKLMTNNTSGINTEMKVNGQKLETVTSFKYLGSVINDEGFKSDILSGTAQTTTALTRLKPVWNDKSISTLSHPSSCMRVNHRPSQQSSKEEYKPWKYASHIRPCYQRRSPCQDLADTKTSWPSQRDTNCSGMVMTSVQQVWLKIILQGTVKGRRKQGRQSKRWEDNIREWTVLEFVKSQRAVENRGKWRKLVAKSSMVPQWPSRLRNRWWRRYSGSNLGGSVV